MKNDQKFKERIAEVAAKIAGIEEKYEDDKMELPSGVLTKLNSTIATPADLASAIIDMVREIVAKEPSMQDIENRAGWSMIFQKLNQLAGKKNDQASSDKPSSDEIPEVPSDMKLPALKEAFDRINRK